MLLDSSETHDFVEFCLFHRRSAGPSLDSNRDPRLRTGACKDCTRPGSDDLRSRDIVATAPASAWFTVHMTRAERSVALLRLDDVVYLEHFRLSRIDVQLGKNRAEACSEGVELLLRVPDLTDLEVVARAEAELVVESVCWKDALFLEPADNFVVLLRGQRRWGEADNQAHESLHVWDRP
jgi:hypothetical protein